MLALQVGMTAQEYVAYLAKEASDRSIAFMNGIVDAKGDLGWQVPLAGEEAAIVRAHMELLEREMIYRAFKYYRVDRKVVIQALLDYSAVPEESEID